MNDPELVEHVRWRVVETLGMRMPSVRTLIIMTPEKLDAIAEAAVTATREWDMP